MFNNIIIAFLICFTSSIYTLNSNRIVILYASIGNGHKVAAEVIRNQALEKDPSLVIDVRDVFEFSPWWTSKIVNTVYNFATQKTPYLYDLHFNYQLNKMAKLNSLSETKNALRFIYSKKLIKYLKNFQPNIIFSTFNHTTEGLIAFKKANLIKDIRIGSTLTDYVSHKYYTKIINESDMTFLPSERLVEFYLNSGADKSKMSVSNIPVNLKLQTKFRRKIRKKLFRKINFFPNRKTVLLISGANGVGNYKTIVNSILKSEYIKQHKLQLIVVAGRNKNNFKQIQKLQDNLPENIKISLHPLVAPQQARDFIKLADLVVTKAGGLTSTELAVASKPAILLDINGGQEKSNCHFFLDCGGTEVTNNQALVGKLLDKSLLTTGRLQQMSAAQAAIFSSNQDFMKIAKWLVDDKALTCQSILTKKAS